MRKFFFFVLSMFSVLQISSQEKADGFILEQDRPVLDSFFREILFFEGFAYTLFGDKPVSICDYNLKNTALFCHTPEGYKIWKKYAALLPSSNFLFLFYENSEKNSCELTLINKKAFRDIFDLHREKFVEIWGNEISSEVLLNLLTEKGSLWNTEVKEKDDLIGILLGYGKVNAELYQRRKELGFNKALAEKHRVNPPKELVAIVAALEPFAPQKPGSPHFMGFPGFMADHTKAETRSLKKKYTEQRKQITEIFSQGKVSEIVLQQLGVLPGNKEKQKV